MGSALVLTGFITRAAGWESAWLAVAALALIAAVGLTLLRTEWDVSSNR
jgi:hypothetical protein